MESDVCSNKATRRIDDFSPPLWSARLKGSLYDVTSFFVAKFVYSRRVDRKLKVVTRDENLLDLRVYNPNSVRSLVWFTEYQ